MHQTDMVEWDEPDAGEAAMPPPQMVLDIETSDVLQLTVSKTVLDVFTNLSQVCQSVTHRCVSLSQVCQSVTHSVDLSQICVWNSINIHTAICKSPLHKKSLHGAIQEWSTKCTIEYHKTSNIIRHRI